MISTKKLQNQLQHKHSMEQVLPQIPDIDFVKYCTGLIEQKGFDKNEIIQKTTLQRNYAYQIFNGTKTGGRDKILQIALAMRANLDECNHLLDLSNNGNLYAKRKRDALLIYALNQHLSVFDTNELLIQYGQPPLS